MEHKLSKHKVYVKSHDMFMVPYSIAIQALEEAQANKVDASIKEISNTVEGLRKDLMELSNLDDKIGL